MVIKTIIAGFYEENCYLIIDEDTKECGIIDPGGQANKLEHEIKALNAIPKYVILTHGHADHTGAVVELCDKFNIPFYINRMDEEYIQKDNSVFGELPKASGYLKEGDILTLGKEIIKVIETPGHTPGGICFLVKDKLFTGDTLFQGSIGRSDFVGGDMGKLIKNIKEKLLSLDEHTEVYPGHGPMSNIGFEKMRNPFLQ